MNMDRWGIANSSHWVTVFIKVDMAVFARPIMFSEVGRFAFGLKVEKIGCLIITVADFIFAGPHHFDGHL